MANLCSTIYKCVGDEKELEKLYQLIKKNYESGEPYICSILESMGVDLKELDNKCLRYRGDVTYFDYDDGILTIDQDTAWCEQEGFRISIEEKYPNVKVFYCEEEPGFGIYRTNDIEGEYFFEKFVIDSRDDHEYFDRIDSVVEYLSKHYGIVVDNETEEGMQASIDKYVRSRNDDFYMYVHEFKYVE